MSGINIFKLLGNAILFTSSLCSVLATAEVGPPEKDELAFGFIKLTDMAPLTIAYEMGFFEDEGLYVTIEAQANWKVLLDGVIDGQLDGAHMLAGQPLAATIGYGTQAHIVTPFSMDLNGNGITVSNVVWEAMQEYIPTEDGKPVHPIHADYLKPVVEQYCNRGEAFNTRWIRSLVLSTLGIVVFLLVWQLAANNMQTSLGQFPGPVQVWEQTQNLAADYKRSKKRATVLPPQ